MSTPTPHTLLSIIALSFLNAVTPQHPDTLPLLSFKSTISDPTNSLSTWSKSNPNPCSSSWTGVSCLQNRVYRLILQDHNLSTSSSSILPLLSLTHLRLLSLKLNRFSGPLPSNLSSLTHLKLLFLSYNSFSGPFPFPLPTSLSRLDLSHNSLSGSIPPSLNRLNRLLTLRLESNRFTGSILLIDIPNLQDFNVSGNLLVGDIPKPLSSFPPSAFGLDSSLCGPPLEQCRSVNPSPSPVVSASSSFKSDRKGLGKVAIVSIVLVDVSVLMVAFLIIFYFCVWRKVRAGRLREGAVLEGGKILYAAGNPYSMGNQQERGKMVFFEGRRFELEDLLRASAEMLGKGGSGTAYKAVMEDGDEVVAVKRIKDGAVSGRRREFEDLMEIVGRLRHDNVVALRAYYFARDEKLLVYDYMPNGSLFWLLHGNRGPGRTPLDWKTRLKIVEGIARGLTYIHHSSCNLIHGNIKSTNILIDREGNARISDFGLSKSINGYSAPESSDPRKITQKADIYSLGVLLLELLTGKCPTMGGDQMIGYNSGVVDLPRWVQSVVREEWTAEVFDLELMRYKDIEEGLVGLLQIAMACTSSAPDQRPKMSQVAKMILEIRGSASDGDLVSDSPSVSEEASGGLSP